MEEQISLAPTQQYAMNKTLYNKELCTHHAYYINITCKWRTRLQAISYIKYKFILVLLENFSRSSSSNHTAYDNLHIVETAWLLHQVKQYTVSLYLSPCLRLINNRGNSCRHAGPNTAVSSRAWKWCDDLRASPALKSLHVCCSSWDDKLGGLATKIE